MKHLYRSDSNKVLAGVIGGLGEYFEVDPVVLRLAFVFLLLATAVVPGVIAYLAAVFIVPRRPAAAP
ncbi:MAG: PspC domain-containing protein [Elusimicrobia bacterium]|nr:PspC domain-containing protein [Elusimicrobiota bacterium]